MEKNYPGTLIHSYVQTTLPDPLPGEEYNVGLAARMLAGTVVQVGQVFSMNGTLGPRTKEKGFREGPAYSGGQIIRVTGGGICIRRRLIR